MPASSLPDLREALDLLENRQPRAAVDVLETITRQLPTYAAAHVLLARAYELGDDWDGALGAWQQAHFLLPSSARVRTGMRTAMRAVYELDSDGAKGDATPRPVAPSVTLPAPSAPVAPVAPPQDAAPVLPSASSRSEEAAPPSPPPRVPPVELPVPFRLGERPSLTPPPQPEPPAPPSWTEVAPLAPRFAPPATPPPPVSASTPTPLLPPPSVQPPAPKSPAPKPPASPDDDLPDGWIAPALDHFDALDDLIDALDGARITPRADLDDLPTPELEQDIGEVVSPTLARIYLTQGQHLEAARIYDKLAAQQPARADEFRTRAAEARAQA